MLAESVKGTGVEDVKLKLRYLSLVLGEGG